MAFNTDIAQMYRYIKLNNSIESKSHKLPEFIDNCNWCIQSQLDLPGSIERASMCKCCKKIKSNFFSHSLHLQNVKTHTDTHKYLIDFTIVIE